MSHDVLLNALRQSAAAMDSQHAPPRWGLVNSFDDATGYVKVMIQPEGVQSGWIPVCYPCVGNGWGIVAPPPMDAQVKLIFENGNGDHPVLLGCTHTVEDAVPMVPAEIGGEATTIKQGEIALVSKAGAVMRLCADGSHYRLGPSNEDGRTSFNGAVAQTNGNFRAGTGATGVFTTPAGQTVTVQDGVITNIF